MSGVLQAYSDGPRSPGERSRPRKNPIKAMAIAMAAMSIRPEMSAREWSIA